MVMTVMRVATPIVIPSTVREARSLWARIESSASATLSPIPIIGLLDSTKREKSEVRSRNRALTGRVKIMRSQRTGRRIYMWSKAMRLLTIAAIGVVGAAAQSLDVSEIMARVARNQTRSQEARRDFTYHQNQLLRMI